MDRSNPRADVARLSQVLADLAFPAAKWQLIMHAEGYGADARTRADLWALPAATYPALVDVLATLGLATPVPAPARHGFTRFRSQPPLQAAAQELPAR